MSAELSFFRRVGAVVLRAAFMVACLAGAYSFVVAVCAFLPFSLLLLGIVVWQHARQWKGTGWAYGTARFATMEDLYAGDLVGNDTGLILARAGPTERVPGKRALRVLFTAALSRSEMACRAFLDAFRNPRRPSPEWIRIRRYVHLLTCASSGAGKSVSILIPNLLTYPHSCVVLDPKLELWSATARHRATVLGQEIVCLAPFHQGDVDTFNPLDFLPADLDEARALAEAMVLRTGHERDPHWDESAIMVLTAFLVFILFHAEGPDRNLQTLRELITDPEAFAGAIKLMRQSEACDGLLRRLGNQLLRLQDKELSSVLSTLNRHTTFLDSPAVAASTRASSFDPARLRSHRVTIYLGIPAHLLESQSRLVRLWITSFLKCLIRTGADERRPVLFLLDEVGQLGGNLQTLENAITLMRGYGIRCWLFVQSLNQLQKCFGENAPTVLDNIGTQQYFGLNALATANELSERLGAATIPVFTYQEGDNYSSSTTNSQEGPSQTQHSGGFSTSTSVAETARQLLQASEVLQLPDDQTLIFTRGVPPIRGTLLRYYDAPEFRSRFFATVLAFRQRLRLALAALLLLAGSLVLAAFATQALIPGGLPLRGQLGPTIPYAQPRVPSWDPRGAPAYGPGSYPMPAYVPPAARPSPPLDVQPQYAPFQRQDFVPQPPPLSGAQ